jgi:hypothetical protein
MTENPGLFQSVLNQNFKSWRSALKLQTRRGLPVT